MGDGKGSKELLPKQVCNSIELLEVHENILLSVYWSFPIFFGPFTIIGRKKTAPMAIMFHLRDVTIVLRSTPSHVSPPPPPPPHLLGDNIKLIFGTYAEGDK